MIVRSADVVGRLKVGDIVNCEHGVRVFDVRFDSGLDLSPGVQTQHIDTDTAGDQIGLNCCEDCVEYIASVGNAALWQA